MPEKRYRSFLKGISWRIVASLDTMAVSYFHTSDALSSLKITITEILTKIVLYYVHERIYFKTFGSKVHLRKVSFIKGVTWRFVGSLDTFLISWIVMGDPFVGFKIASTEFITKILLYYIHERVWLKVKIGKMPTQ